MERLEYDISWELEDDDIPLDKHTVSIMVAMSNSIREAIQMEGDYCSNHQDGYIPVLDLKMKTVLVYQPSDPDKGTPEVTYYQVTFKFYKKPKLRKRNFRQIPKTIQDDTFTERRLLLYSEKKGRMLQKIPAMYIP